LVPALLAACFARCCTAPLCSLIYHCVHLLSLPSLPLCLPRRPQPCCRALQFYVRRPDAGAGRLFFSLRDSRICTNLSSVASLLDVNGLGHGYGARVRTASKIRGHPWLHGPQIHGLGQFFSVVIVLHLAIHPLPPVHPLGRPTVLLSASLLYSHFSVGLDPVSPPLFHSLSLSRSRYSSIASPRRVAFTSPDS
jgi:hypothetical protein